MSVEKTFHCTFCGHEVKAKTCPIECSCCGQSRFFIDLSSYNQLESEYNNIKGITKCSPPTSTLFPETKPRVRGSLGPKTKTDKTQLLNQIKVLENQKNNWKTEKNRYQISITFLFILSIIFFFI